MERIPGDRQPEESWYIEQSWHINYNHNLWIDPQSPEKPGWFDNMSWMWQVKIFFEQLKRDGFLSLSEDENFNIMKISLPWGDTIQLLSLKNTISTDIYDGYTKQETILRRKDKTDIYDEKARILWCEWASKEDIVKLHEKMFELFSKLWNSEKLNREDPFTFIARFLECGFPWDDFLLKDLVHHTNSETEKEDKGLTSNCLLCRFSREFPNLNENGNAYTCWTWEDHHPLYISRVI